MMEKRTSKTSSINPSGHFGLVRPPYIHPLSSPNLPLSTGNDPYWEAVNLWYGATADLEWYGPQQVTTCYGSLVITMDSYLSAGVDTRYVSPYLLRRSNAVCLGSTVPFTAAQNNALGYRGGMLWSWNEFYFTSGYIEVSVVLPGPDENIRGYVSLFSFHCLAHRRSLTLPFVPL
jgi:hypothetical protein